MYVPKKGHDPAAEKRGIWSTAMPFEGESYVVPWNLEEQYDLFAKYPHRCGKCKGAAAIMSEEAFEQGITDSTIVCPCCGSALESDGWVIMWD